MNSTYQPPESSSTPPAASSSTTVPAASAVPPASGAIPQYIVIHDHIHDTYKHPIQHFVFEDEPFPDIAKDKLVVVDVDKRGRLNVASYSPHLQIFEGRLEQSTVSDPLEANSASQQQPPMDPGLLTLILEGVSAPQGNEAIESLQSIQDIDTMKDMLANFKHRNELVRKVFQQ
ncbi:hypothetical protein BC940DRAFT_304648 [Gongronella butleri]|nr:hypothetical protein BC940DRAFT_304648 [Gongronella butleri]